jgi:hypothetical protein
MGHYDLYSSLGLDRWAPPDALAAELDRRIAWAQTGNPSALDELHCARAILGDPGRRTTYDRMLDNPAGPPVTTDTLRQLAASAPGGGSSGSPGSSGGRGALRILVPVITLLVGLGLGAGAVALFAGDDGDSGQAISTGDREEAESLTQEFIVLDSRDAALDWAEDHFDRRVRNELIEELGASGSLRDFTGMEDLFGGTGLATGPATEFSSVVAYEAIASGISMQDALDSLSSEQNFGTGEMGSSLMVPVLDRSDRALGFVVFIDDGGDYRVAGFVATGAVTDSGYGWDA